MNIMYYYPYLLHLVNLFSFRHHNEIHNHNIQDNTINSSDKTIDLWSINRWSYTKYKGYKTFTAKYNYFTKIYELDGKRYASYDDLVKDAFNL